LPPTNDPLISVIILNYNGEKWMRRCLQSLQEQTIFNRIEVIVADNTSSDGSDRLAEELLKDWPNGLFIQNGGNKGFAWGTNLAVEKARGKYLFFLNPDVWLEKDCLERLFNGTEAKRAGAGGLLVLDYDDDTVQSRGAAGFDIFGILVAPWDSNPKPFFAPCGFSFIRTDLFRKIGRLDDKYFLYGEETDLAWRLWIAGETAVHVPEARMHHRGSASVNPKGGTKIVESRTSDAKRFYANRNHLLTLCKNCQHFLLLLVVSCSLFLFFEALIGALLLRRWSFFQESFLRPMSDCWDLRGYILEKRKSIGAFRKRSDFYMLHFLTWRLGRWQDFARIMKKGLPIVDPRPKPKAQGHVT
jgi:GT2 family glycosyltransferase